MAIRYSGPRKRQPSLNLNLVCVPVRYVARSKYLSLHIRGRADRLGVSQSYGRILSCMYM
eukprot:SAG31_NODE_1341_length_8708_cov_10.945174_8_plen_60_part_00